MDYLSEWCGFTNFGASNDSLLMLFNSLFTQILSFYLSGIFAL